MSTKIEVAMITDDNYVMPTVVAINSILKNKKTDTFCKIYVLTNKISIESKLRLESIVGENFEVKVLDESDLVDNFPKLIQKRHVTLTAVLKIFLPEIFSDLDKILYLDSDIIVQTDLSDLFNTDIGDVYAGVVKDILAIKNKKLVKKLKLNSTYFNSGVLLLNLQKLRQEKVVEKLLDYRINGYNYFMDQDVLNVVFGKNVKYLSWKYNFLNYYLETLSLDKLQAFFEEEFPKADLEVYQSSAVIHLGGYYKPWKYDIGYLSKLYQEYMDFAGIHLSLETLKTIEKESRIKKFIKKIKNKLKK